MGGCAGMVLSPRVAGAARVESNAFLRGAALRALLEEYDMLGEHRTAGPGDNATSAWLAGKFDRGGFETRLPSFGFDLFEPSRSELSLSGKSVTLFPAWPVVDTPLEGVTGSLVAHDASSVAGKIAVIALPYKPYATWAQPIYGEPVKSAIERGARAVIAITEGPTGEIIALNALPSRFNWTIPVLLAAEKDKPVLLDAVARGANATVFSLGHRTPNAKATNVLARRTGKGKTIVLSTPKSGWFHCASERGSGIAIFLGLAQWLARESSADLLCIATSGHEIDGTGGKAFLVENAPKPDQVRLWLHIGANVACNAIGFSGGLPVREPAPDVKRRITASAPLLDATRASFKGLQGYDEPVDAGSANAVGEALIFRDAHYSPILSPLGSSPLFHTRLDRSQFAATPEVLETVAHALASAIAQTALVP
ncbi:MAG: hypothetical protein JSR55_01630 [Proteobacteria bacterium]|nr:hypothetical protein [Pseudomonadota bacterium]